MTDISIPKCGVNAVLSMDKFIHLWGQTTSNELILGSHIWDHSSDTMNDIVMWLIHHTDVITWDMSMV